MLGGETGGESDFRDPLPGEVFKHCCEARNNSPGILGAA